MSAKDDHPVFIQPAGPLGRWDQLTKNEQAWVEFIRVISCGRDQKITSDRMRRQRAESAHYT